LNPTKLVKTVLFARLSHVAEYEKANYVDKTRSLGVAENRAMLRNIQKMLHIKGNKIINNIVKCVNVVFFFISPYFLLLLTRNAIKLL